MRLKIAAPDSAFGHAEYPLLLTRTLAENARRKKTQPLPNPPYTPLIEQLVLNYRAGTVLELDKPGATAPGRLDEKVFHVHPFGRECVYPVEQLAGHRYFLPQYPQDGNLFIGVRASRPGGPLSLLFHLTEDVPERPVLDSSEVTWFYLASEGWRRLADTCVLADSTEGFLTTGVVVLDLPDAASRSNPVMPQGLYWLRATTNQSPATFSNLHAIRAQAVRVSKANDARPQPGQPSVGSEWQPLTAASGINAVRQPVAAFGGRVGETEAELKTRVSERLRHRQRASSPWDYERLILQRFPGIRKVKCFPSMVAYDPSPRPGHVLIAVVPQVQRGGEKTCAQASVDAVQLKRIRDYVRTLSSPFVTIDVRNPVYERVQIRCTVKLSGRDGGGHGVSRLNQAISDYICPWCEGGYGARFGWSVRREDIESFIRELDYVEFVTNFSMLHITRDEASRYTLGDTARTDRVSESETVDTITPRFAWSLAMPATRHAIETIGRPRTIAAEPTGIDELAVGDTFIIDGRAGHG